MKGGKRRAQTITDTVIDVEQVLATSTTSSPTKQTRDAPANIAEAIGLDTKSAARFLLDYDEREESFRLATDHREDLHRETPGRGCADEDGDAVDGQ
jgi:hypothetical protein